MCATSQRCGAHLELPMRALYLLIGIVPSIASAAQSDDITQVFNDPTPVSRALSRGDVTSLRRLQQNGNDPIMRKMAKAAERRVLLDLQGTLQSSQDCLDAAEKTSHFGGMVVCGLLEASAQAAMGNLPAWAKLTVDSRDRIHALSAQRGKVLGNVDVFSLVPDYRPLFNRRAPRVARLAPGRIPLHKGSVTVAAASWHGGGQVTYPNMANVLIDGKSTEMLVDTGAFQTTVRSSAVSTPPFMDWLLLAGVFGTSGSRSALTQPQKLQMESLTISEPFVATNDHLNVNLLGMDVLSRLGRMVLSAESIEIMEPARSGPVCRSPLFVAPDLAGTASMPRMFIDMEGKRQEVMLDTGYNGELMEVLPVGSKLPIGELEHSVTQGVQGQQRRSSVSRSVDVLTTGGPAKLTMSTSIGEHSVGTYYLLGGGGLKNVSVYMDFINRKACLLPR